VIALERDEEDARTYPFEVQGTVEVHFPML
jgi:hypothetical protein